MITADKDEASSQKAWKLFPALLKFNNPAQSQVFQKVFVISSVIILFPLFLYFLSVEEGERRKEFEVVNNRLASNLEFMKGKLEQEQLILKGIVERMVLQKTLGSTTFIEQKSVSHHMLSQPLDQAKNTRIYLCSFLKPEQLPAELAFLAQKKVFERSPGGGFFIFDNRLLLFYCLRHPFTSLPFPFILATRELDKDNFQIFEKHGAVDFMLKSSKTVILQTFTNLKGQLAKLEEINFHRADGKLQSFEIMGESYLANSSVITSQLTDIQVELIIGIQKKGLNKYYDRISRNLLVFFVLTLILIFIFSLVISGLSGNRSFDLIGFIKELRQGNFDSRINLENSLDRDYIVLGKELNILADSLCNYRMKFSNKLVEFRSLFQIVSALNESKDYQDLLGRILEVSINAIGAERGSMMFMDPQSDELIVKVIRGKITFKHYNFKPIPIGKGICGRVVKDNKALLVNAGAKDPRFYRTQTEEISSRILSLLCVPLVYQDRAIGVINLVNKVGHTGFIEEDLELLKKMAAQACVTLQNKKLYDLATKDGLTSLFLNRYFQARLKEELIRSRRYQLDLSLIILDIDELKEINDRFGNAIGDKAISLVGEEINRSIRRNIDIAARLNTTQLSVLLPETGARHAHQFAERLRLDIEKVILKTESDEEVNLTASFGVSCFPSSANTREELFKQADISLYHSKSQGKNRVTSYFDLEKNI
ncbi:diguanylate cyclase [Candidatus Riflebacteria bacterium]